MEEQAASTPCPSCNAFNIHRRTQCWRCGACLRAGYYLDAAGNPQLQTTAQEIRRLLDQADTLAPQGPPRRARWPRFRRPAG